MFDLWSWSFLSSVRFYKYPQNQDDRTPGDFSPALELLNSGEKTSCSLENFSIAVLVGNTLQIRGTGLGIILQRITLSMSVRDMVQLWLQKTLSHLWLLMCSKIILFSYWGVSYIKNFL